MAEGAAVPDRMLTRNRPAHRFTDASEPLWRGLSHNDIDDERRLTDLAIPFPNASFNRSRPGNEPPGHFTDLLRNHPEWGILELTAGDLTFEQPNHDATHIHQFAPVHRPEDSNYYHAQFEDLSAAAPKKPSPTIRQEVRLRLFDQARILRYPSDEPVVFPD